MIVAGVPLELRPAEDGDVALIYSTCLQSHAEGYPRRDRPAAMALFRRSIRARLIECDAVVACSPELRTTVFGWACGGNGNGALHYVYVPRELRGNGLARALITAALGSYPARIEVTRRWPGPSTRFQFVQGRKAA